MDGQPAYQHPYGPVAAAETADPGPWSCGFWRLCRGSDASFYLNWSSRVMERGLIARPNAIGGSLIADQAEPYFMVVGTSDGFVGQEVWKIGRTSGWRVGTIVETCVSHNLTGLPGYFRTVPCSNESTNFNEGGDSGGPVFLSMGGPYVYLSGTTIGRPDGTTFTHYSTISQIQSDFGGALAVDRPPMLSTPSVTGSIPTGTPSISWGAIGGASAYHVYRQSDGIGAFTLSSTTTSTTYVDGAVYAIAVLGGPPSSGPFVAYKVRAANTADVSLYSNTVYFQKPPAITVSIQGPSGVQPQEGCYWSSVVSGGSGTYNYQWTVNGGGTFPNSSQLFYPNDGSSFVIRLVVTDGTSAPGNDERPVSVSWSNPSCPF